MTPEVGPEPKTDPLVETDCFWCGDLLFKSTTRLVCRGCAASFDPSMYKSLPNDSSGGIATCPTN